MDIEISFNHCWGVVKLVHASLSVRKDPECRFYDSRGSVKLMKASLHVWKDIESCFPHCGGVVNLVRTSLCIRNDSENSFLCCGGLVKLFYVCLSGGPVFLLGGSLKVVPTTVKVLWRLDSLLWVAGMLLRAIFTTVAVLCRLFTSVCQNRFRMQFSPMWRSCEASACLIECQNGFRKQSLDLHQRR